MDKMNGDCDKTKVKVGADSASTLPRCSDQPPAKRTRLEEPHRLGDEQPRRQQEEEQQQEPSSREEVSLAKGEARIKFVSEFITDPPFTGLPDDAPWEPLAEALALSERLGAAPVLPDGKVGGNGSAFVREGIIISKSGRCKGVPFTEGDFVLVTAFDAGKWRAEYRSVSEAAARPSSDTPLHWHALRVAPDEFGWSRRPRFVWHGHSCATEKEAEALGFPCSAEETMFSTPEDLAALMDLFRKYPYPKHQVYVRKNHGFFLLADDPDEALRIFQEKLDPQRAMVGGSKGEPNEDEPPTTN